MVASATDRHLSVTPCVACGAAESHPARDTEDDVGVSEEDAEDSDVEDHGKVVDKIYIPAPVAAPPADIGAYPEYVQAAMRRRGDKPIRLYADGIFDLFPYGHSRVRSDGVWRPCLTCRVWCCVAVCTPHATRCLGERVMCDDCGHSRVKIVREPSTPAPDCMQVWR